MNTIRLFLACSRDLKEEVAALTQHVDEINDQQNESGVRVKLVVAHRLSQAQPRGRKQDDLNAELLKCDLVVCLFHRKVGRYTKEELDTAQKALTEGGRPKLLVLFRELLRPPEDLREAKELVTVFELRAALDRDEKFYKTYRNTEGLCLTVGCELTNHLLPRRPPVSQAAFMPRRPVDFVDREQEYEKIVGFLKRDRVVLICGMSGMGKSGLAKKIAYHPDFNSDVCFLPVAKSALDDMLGAFGIFLMGEPLQGSTTERGAIIRRKLGTRRVLVILDNLGERNQGAAEAFVEIVQGCPVLITLRTEKINIPAAEIIHLTELRDTARMDLISKKIGRVDSVADRRAIKGICDTIGGIPLALELLARRLSQPDVTPQDMAAWIKDEGPGAFDKHESILRTIFDHTYASLPPKAQKLFTALGAFPGETFDVTAAEAVSGNRRAKQVINSHLVLLSMVWRAVEPGRFCLHPLLKTYARDSLQELAPDLSAPVYGRLLDYYLSFAEKYGVRSNDYPKLDLDRANIIGSIDVALARNEDRKVIRLANALAGESAYYGFFLQYGYWDEAVEKITEARDAGRRLGEPRAEAGFESSLGLLYNRMGDNGKARECCNRAMTLYDTLGDKRAMITVHHRLGYIEDDVDNYAEARKHYEASLAMARGLRDRELIALGHHLVGVIKAALAIYDKLRRKAKETSDADAVRHLNASIARTQRRFSAVPRMQARYVKGRKRSAFLKEAAQLIHSAMRAETARRSLARGQRQLGMLCEEQGQSEWNNANRWYTESLEGFELIGNVKGIGAASCNLGSLYAKMGEVDAARKHLARSLECARQVRCRYGAACVHRELGKIEQQGGKLEKARKCFRESVAILREIDSHFAPEVQALVDALPPSKSGARRPPTRNAETHRGKSSKVKK